MKKLTLLFTAIITAVTLSPSAIAAPVDLSRYASETLEETFAAEQITYDFQNSDYNDNNDVVTIYVFRKDGCINCKNFYNFVKNTLLPNYGSKFRVVSYELSQNKINFTLLNQLADFYNQKPADGIYPTPIVIVGNTISKGSVNSTRQQEIVDIINSNTTFDAVDELNAGITNINNSLKTEFTATSGIILNTATPYYRSHSLTSTPINVSNLTLDGYKDYEYITAHDINFMNNNTPIPLSNTKLTIRIPITNTHKSYKVAYIKNGKISEVIDAKYQNGFITFETSHLSEYAVYGTNTVALTPNQVTQSTAIKNNVPKAPNSGVRP